MSPDLIPPRYRNLYDSLEQKISEFDNSISAQWNGRKSDTVFATELLSANANRGLEMLTEQSQEWLWLELDRIQELGVGAVSIALNFPLLYYPFWEFSGTPQYYRQFLDFYVNLAANIHDRGLKLIVDNAVVFTGYYSEDSGIDVASYYQTLDYGELVHGRCKTAYAIIQEIQPDYLNLGSEPDTQAEILEAPNLATPEGYGTFMTTVVAQLREHTSTRIPLGAGVGTWKSKGTEYVDALASAGVDTIDCHLYPVNFECLSRVDDLAACAQSHGKRFAIGEAWLQKRRNAEFTTTAVASTPVIFSRDAFDFWKPLDTAFLKALVKFSHYRELAYFSGFWSRYFWAYLEYSACRGEHPDEVIGQACLASAVGLKAGHVTSTGEAYRQAIMADFTAAA